MILFNHTGNLGDLLYSFYFISELKEYAHEKIWLHLQTNVEFKYAQKHPNGSVGFTKTNVESFLPLLKKQILFDKITYGDEIPKHDKIIDLSLIRKMPINFQAGNIVQWYYNLCNVHLSQIFSKPLLFVEPDFSLKDKIILMKTTRYENEFLDYKVLKKYDKNLIFIGMKNEHEEFNQRFFKVEYFKVDDALHFAKLLQGAKGIISNANGFYAIAELMKVPRILMTPEYMKLGDHLIPGPVNVHPNGGWFEVAETTQKLETSIKNMIDA